MLKKYSEIQTFAEGILEKFQAFLKAPQVPELEVRRQLLDELEKATAELPELSLNLSNICEAVSVCERELRRRARQEAQERDLARWEHYTLKMDICSELEKFSQAPDHELLEVLLKVVGISLVAELASMICTDAGNAALGKVLQMLSTAVILCMSIPLLDKLLELISSILGGI